MQGCTIEAGSDEGKIVNFAQGGPVRYEFVNNTVSVLSRGLLVNVYNGSRIVDNEIDLLSEHYSDAYRMGAISLTAVSGGDGVEIKGNTFKNANRVLGVDHATIEGTKIAFSKNKMVNCRFAFEFDPRNEGVENADAGTYDIEYNYYSFDGKAMAPRVEDASSSGSHFDGSTEYVPTGASRVKNSVYYLRDTMRDQDLNTYVPPVPPPTPSDKTEVEKNPDGSTTTTVTKPDGSQTIAHETATGTESVVKKDEDGKVELPLADAESGSDVEKASVVEVKVPASVSDKAPVQVTVPVAKDEGDELNYGIVVFAVDAEGNETVIPKCAVDDDGNVVFEATGDVTIKVVDNAKDMPDVEETDWFAGEVSDFARDAMSWAVVEGLFSGDDVTGELNPTDGAARAEVATLLMRFINLMYA